MKRKTFLQLPGNLIMLLKYLVMYVEQFQNHLLLKKQKQVLKLLDIDFIDIISLGKKKKMKNQTLNCPYLNL